MVNLQEEWKQLLEKNDSFYVYGAGKIGKKIINLFKKENKIFQIKAIIVTQKDGNPATIDGVPVIEVDDVSDKEDTVLVSVADTYQLEIVENLKKSNFTNIVIAYKYSYLGGEDESKGIPSVVDIDIRELLLQQYEKKEFNRYDILVRLLAVEEYYRLNDIGFDLYCKMQNLRVRNGYGVLARKRFTDLIQSFEQNGYDENSEIIVDKELKLIDGAHRIALALCRDVKKVKIRILDKISDVQYDLKWFQARFSDKEVQLLISKYEQWSNRWRHSIKGVIWPSAIQYSDEILKEISQRYEINGYVDYDFPKEIFEQFVRGIYHIDNIAKWKVETKIQHFIKTNNYRIRMLDIGIPLPDFRIKGSGTTISQVGEKLKKDIRNKYKEKIDNYFYDIVFHTADNFYQSEYMDALVKPVFSLQELFEDIKEQKWMLIKTENDYFPKNFPDTYPMYKDIDLICSKHDFEALTNIIYKFYEKYENEQYRVTVVKKNEDNQRIRFELEGFLIFQVDVSSGFKGIKDLFIEKSLNDRILRNGYYVAQVKDEIVYRMHDLYYHPQKEKHRRYVLQYWSYFEKEYLRNCINEKYGDEFIKRFEVTVQEREIDEL